MLELFLTVLILPNKLDEKGVNNYSPHLRKINGWHDSEITEVLSCLIGCCKRFVLFN